MASFRRGTDGPDALDGIVSPSRKLDVAAQALRELSSRCAFGRRGTELVDSHGHTCRLDG